MPSLSSVLLPLRPLPLNGLDHPLASELLVPLPPSVDHGRAMAKFIPSISTSSPGAFEQPLQSPLSTSMSSHHQSSERSGWRDEGHEDETAPVEEQAELEQQQGELEDVKPVDQDGWMEGAPGQEGGEEGEARWPDEADAELAHHGVDENAVYQEEDEEHKVHHDDGSHLHESEHLETDEGAHGHVQQAEEEGHPEDDPHANGAQQAAASAAQGYVYPHSPASAQQTHPNDSRPASGTSSPYHANGAQAGYASQHLQQPHAASAYAAPYPTTGSQAYYGVPSTHPLQNSHYPTSSLPPSYGSPSSQHQAYPTTSAYGYPPQQPYPTSYNYLGAQSSGSNQYGSSANAYRPSQPMQGHMQHQLSLPHLGAVTSASRTGVDEAGRMSAAHSEHSYDQNDVEGRAELGRLLEGGIGIDPSVQNAVAKNGGVNKAKKRKSEGDALGAEGQYQGEDGSELGGEGEDGEGGGKKRKRASMGDANGGPKDKKHICPECSRGFARAYNLKVSCVLYDVFHRRSLRVAHDPLDVKLTYTILPCLLSPL